MSDYGFGGNIVLRRINKWLLRGYKYNEADLLEILRKKLELIQKHNTVTTLVLGSSHGAYDIDTSLLNNGTFNLCSTSQDIYYSYKLLEYFLARLPNLKSIIFCYSTFSRGFEVQRTIDKHVSAYYKYIYDIPFKYKADEGIEKDIKACMYYIKAQKTIQVHDVWGYQPVGRFFKADVPAADRCRFHLRENRRQNDQFIFFSEMHRTCLKNKLALLVLIPPTRDDYRRGLPPKDEIFAHMYSYSRKNEIPLIDMFDFANLDYEDFGDFDHLNLNGARKFTREIFITADRFF